MAKAAKIYKTRVFSLWPIFRWVAGLRAIINDALGLKPRKPFSRRQGPHSIFDIDQDVRRFVENQLATHATFSVIAEECLARFGKDRAPSRSAIHRYYQRLRK